MPNGVNLAALMVARDRLQALADGANPVDKDFGICNDIEQTIKESEFGEGSGYFLCSEVFEMMQHDGWHFEDIAYPMGGKEEYDRSWHERSLWKGDKRRNFAREMIPFVQRLIDKQEEIQQ